MSTTCTGYSVFDIETKKLITYGIIKPRVPLVSKMKYPRRQLEICRNLREQIGDLISQLDSSDNVNIIVIEEIAGSKNRLGQKTLDILHGIVWDGLCKRGYLERVCYYDVSGSKGWRTDLKLRLSDADKANNKEARLLNKKIQKGTRKLPIIGPKHLAAEYVNRRYGTLFDVDLNSRDNDLADSIAIGSAFLQFRLKDLLL